MADVAVTAKFRHRVRRYEGQKYKKGGPAGLPRLTQEKVPKSYDPASPTPGKVATRAVGACRKSCHPTCTAVQHDPSTPRSLATPCPFLYVARSKIHKLKFTTRAPRPALRRIAMEGSSVNKRSRPNENSVVEGKTATTAQDMYELGLRLHHGEKGILVPDRVEGAKWIRRAAELGLADAQNALGRYYQAGWGVGQDDDEAAKWFHRAAKQGNTDAEYNLAVCYRNGLGVSADEDEAIKYFRRAAERGDAEAQLCVAHILHHGYGQPVDHVEALRWYTEAAAQGDDRAQVGAGIMHIQGLGLAAPDHSKGVAFLEAAVLQGNVRAHILLGQCHVHGLGVPKDRSKALYMFKKGADVGEPDFCDTIHARTMAEALMSDNTVLTAGQEDVKEEGFNVPRHVP